MAASCDTKVSSFLLFYHYLTVLLICQMLCPVYTLLENSLTPDPGGGHGPELSNIPAPKIYQVTSYKGTSSVHNNNKPEEIINKILNDNSDDSSIPSDQQQKTDKLPQLDQINHPPATNNNTQNVNSNSLAIHTQNYVSKSDLESSNLQTMDRMAPQTSQILKTTKKPLSSVIPFTRNVSYIHSSNVTKGYLDPKYYREIYIKYRSRDSFWAVISLGSVCGLLFVSVCYSKMWRTRGIYPDTTPIPDQFSAINDLSNTMPIKELLELKMRYLPDKLRASFQKTRRSFNRKYSKLNRQKVSTINEEGDEEILFESLP